MIRYVHPDWDLDFLPIPDLGVKKATDPGSRIRNIAIKKEKFLCHVPLTALCKKGIVNIYYLSRECRGLWPAFWQPTEIHASGEDSPEPLVRGASVLCD
jgi:hypothetical protein